MSQPPEEVAELLSVAPGNFVDERLRVARALRDAGRRDAEKVAALRKPTAVVLAVNRAARERPDFTGEAVAAAGRVRKTQPGGARRLPSCGLRPAGARRARLV
jgi:hypothetical protein